MTELAPDWPRRSTASRVGAAILAAIGSLSWSFVWFPMVFLLPRFVQVFEDMNAEVPALTCFFIASERVIGRWWFIGLPAWLLGTAGIAAWAGLARGRSALTWALAFALTVTILAFVTGALLTMGLLVPMASIFEGVNR
jgi:hypothetical protein